MTNSYKDLSLVEAIQQKRIDIVKKRLQEGWDPNELEKFEKYYSQRLPLEMATQKDLIEEVQLLLEYGGNSNCLNRCRETPLYHAILSSRSYAPEDNKAERKKNRLNIIKLFIANGGDLSLVIRKGRVLHRIIGFAGQAELAVIKEQLIQNAIYFTLMSSFSTVPFEERGENGKFASVLWALCRELSPIMQVFCKRPRGNIQMEDSAVSLRLPLEMWTRIFVFVLEASLKEKSLALLHIFPYQSRQVNVIQRILYWLLKNNEKREFPFFKQVRDDAITKADKQISSRQFTLSP
jgi:hypothetical protein